jgi:tRNA pseudouridine13 synthase
LQVPKLEKQMGIEVYATHSAGIGGAIRENVEDFVVEEVLVDGSKAPARSSNSNAECQVLGCSSIENRYLLCIMVKRNWDTLVAVENIANQLGIGTEQIHIAGIKDAKALTAQHLTIEGASAEKVQKIHVKDIEIHPLGYLRNKLSSYYLLGNSFHIRIRAVNHSETVMKKSIAETVNELKALGGIPNFFGHQRFGTTRPITHLVGKAIIKKDFKKAAMLFLAKSSHYEHPSSQQARNELRATQDFERALKEFPRQLRFEKSMLRHLVKHPDDFTGAFRTLPFKLQEMFIQAFESYLFNKFLSRRITLELPLNVAEVGDYVMAVERSGLATPTIFKTVNAGKRTEINNSIRAGKSRLALPLIGFKQHASQGAQGEIEREILEGDNVSPEDFKITGMPEISTRGRLRTATTPVNNLITDEISSDANRPGTHEIGVSFMLHRGSYATIVLRELMKPRDIIKKGF